MRYHQNTFVRPTTGCAPRSACSRSRRTDGDIRSKPRADYPSRKHRGHSNSRDKPCTTNLGDHHWSALQQRG
eukprot:3514580-Pyramimonas_sp.AAC.1